MNNNSSEILLPGLFENIPRDFLATLGLHDWLCDLFANHQPKISWSASSGNPSIHVSIPLPPNWAETIFDGIKSWQSLESNPFGLGKIEGIPAKKLRELLGDCKSSQRLVRFYSGISSQLIHEGTGRRSELIIESASRSVLKGVDDIIRLTRNPVDLWGDLSGQSNRREVSNTSRWHPAEYQPAAYVATDPQHNKHQDRLGLNVLALFGTSSYPVVEIQGGRSTPGFRRISKINEFSWPVWSTPLSLDETRGLIHHPAIHQEKTETRYLTSLGVHRVWRSRKFMPDGNNDFFSAASST